MYQRDDIISKYKTEMYPRGEKCIQKRNRNVSATWNWYIWETIFKFFRDSNKNKIYILNFFLYIKEFLFDPYKSF